MKAEEPGVASRVRAGLFSVGALRISQRCLGLFRMVALTHLLDPREVGMVMVGLLAIDTLHSLTANGLMPAIVQRREDPNERMHAAWTFNLARAITLCALALLLAPWLARAFGVPEGTRILQALSFVLVLNALASGATTLLRRELNLTPLNLAQFTAAALEVIVTLGLAWWYRSPWALVAGQIALATTNTLLTYAIHPFRPKLDFGWGKLKALLPVAVWIGLGFQVQFLSRRIDDALVGIMAGPAALGLYQPAYRLANLPASEGSEVATAVFFPGLAQLQDDPAALRRMYGRLIEATAHVTLPFAGLLILLGPAAVDAGFGEAWGFVGTLLPLLAVQGVCQALGETARPLLYAVGRPRPYTLLKSLQTLLFVALGVPLILSEGVWGAAIANLIATAAIGIPCLLVAGKHAGLSMATVARHLTIPMSAAALGIAAWYAVTLTLNSPDQWVVQFAGCVAAAVGYGVACFVAHRFARQQNG